MKNETNIYGKRARIGYTSPPMLTEVFPYEFYKIVPEGVTLIVTTLAILQLNASEVNQSREIALNAAKEMARAGADVVVLGGVPINLSVGLENVDDLMMRTEKECGVPVTSSLQAQMQALKAVGARRVGVVQPFDEAHSTMYEYIEIFGFEVRGIKHAGYPAIDLGRIPLDVAIDSSRELVKEHPDIDTLMFPCPHWAVSTSLEQLERELKVNAIGACQAITWKALRMCGVNDRIPGYGRLLAEN